MTDKYTLNDDGNPVPCYDLLGWAEWFEQSGAARRIAYDDLGDSVSVSTVFLGLDHSSGRSVPILWESMVFGGPLDQEQHRYTSRANAVTGHERLVERVRDSMKSLPERT